MENIRIYICQTCSKIHVEIGNTIIHFASPEKLKTYLIYLDSIDVDHYSEINRKKRLSKDIFLQITNDNFLAFTVAEFEQLKQVIFDYLTGTDTFINTTVFQSIVLN
jgi:hypothetical protein